MSRKNTLESFMGIVEQSHEKTAGQKKIGGELLAKLAAELDVGNPVEAASAAAGPAAPTAAAAAAATASVAPTVEGQRAPAESIMAMANPEVVASTAAVTDPQVAIAGGNLAESAAGEMSPPIKANQGVVISAVDGTVATANTFSRDPVAAAAAAEEGGGAESSEGPEMPDEKEAEKIGALIARSFHSELQKIASQQEFVDSVAYLQENDMLTNYNFKNGVTGLQKTASVEETDGLEKIANNANLSRGDIINAARELAFIEKNAAAAEEHGREQARALIAAAQEIGQSKQADPEVAKYAQDQEVMNAVAILKSKGLL